MPERHLPIGSAQAISEERDSTSGTYSARITTDSVLAGRSGWENSTTATTRVSSSSILSSSARHNSSIQELQRFRLWLTEAAISAGPPSHNYPPPTRRTPPEYAGSPPLTRFVILCSKMRFTTPEPQRWPQMVL